MDDPASNLLAFLAEGVPHLPTLFSVLAKLFAVLFFVGANAFFVGAEFSLVSVRRTRLETRAATGSRRARAALRLISNPTVFISATQLGITLASLALGWIGEPTIAALLEPVAKAIAPAGKAGYVAHLLAIVIAFTVITFLHIVLGELMPKMVALERAETLALFAARPLELFAKVFRWPLSVFNYVGAQLGRLLGLKRSLQHMQKAKAHFGFVVDEHGGIEGIITLEDLLEEIVGEISDEHDEEVNEQITKIDSRTYELDGALAVRDLNRRLKTALPESETYITVGGFLMTEAG